jgi:hypothetical protein
LPRLNQRLPLSSFRLARGEPDRGDPATAITTANPRRDDDMLKLAAIIGGVLLMAGVAFAGTRTLLEQTTGPTLGTTVQPPVTTTSREDEAQGRENEVGEDLRGPCDEAEHANDPRCTGAAVTPETEDDEAAAGGDDDDRGRGANSGPSDRSGHESDDDHGGHSDHGGGGDDD